MLGEFSTVSNSPNPSRVYIRRCKHGKRFLLLKYIYSICKKIAVAVSVVLDCYPCFCVFFFVFFFSGSKFEIVVFNYPITSCNGYAYQKREKEKAKINFCLVLLQKIFGARILFFFLIHWCMSFAKVTPCLFLS